MKARPAEPLLRDIQTLFRGGATGGLTDGELLARFVATGDEAAFEVLVHRLGPMVLGVCRRMLHDRHDAEDAFQATFLVLARRAASVDPPDRVGPWLYGVARRVADRARSVRARRRMREAATASVPEPAIETSRHDDLLPLLDRELGRLPEKYRAPIVLCHLEGKPYREAARQLGCPEGTLAGRLTRGRALLAARLNRLGVAMSAGALASLLAKEASARVPTAWAASAAGMACGFRSEGSAAIAAGVAALAKGTLRSMLMTRLRVASAAIVAVGVIGVGAAAGRGDDPKPAPKGEAEARQEQQVLLRWPSGPIHPADVLYARLVDDPAKAEGGVSGPIERVEAYKIGDDLYVNVAPAGSGRLVLERVANRTTPIEEKPATEQPDATKKADAPKKPDAPKKADSRVDAVRALDDLRVDLTDLFIAGNPADPAAAARLEKLTAGAYNLGDTAFARRIYLDTLGRVPTDDEVRTYVESDAPDKAEILVRRLVDDPAAFEQIKKSLNRRAAARVAETRRAVPAPMPVRFTIERATLDRVDLPNGNLIDVRLDYFTSVGSILPDGRYVPTTVGPSSRLQAIPVAVDAPIRIEDAAGASEVGKGEAMLKRLKPGMRLTIEFVAGPSALAVRSITARPSPQPAAVPYDPFFLYYGEFKPAAPQPRR